MKRHSIIATIATWGAIVTTALLPILPRSSAMSGSNLTEYQQSLMPTALEIEEEFGINPAITLAIASHETADGEAVIGCCNHWGIKGDAVEAITTEFYGNSMIYETHGFADKGSDRLFAETVVNILAEHGEQPGLTYSDPERAIALIGPIYATDPNWSRVVSQHWAAMNRR